MAEYTEREETLEISNKFDDITAVVYGRKIANLPAADVAPVRHGRWLTWEEKFPERKTSRAAWLGVFCDRCGNHADNMSDFCPNCGAKMDGGDDDAAD